MENIKFIGAENEVQKIYSNLGLIVPVGDLDTGKSPVVQVLPATSTTDSITATFNVISNAEISALSYVVNEGEPVTVTPATGAVTISLTELEKNSGPYTITLTAVNENGSTDSIQHVALQPYTNWATADEVLNGNKFIGEDGEEHVGEYVVPEPTYVGLNIAPSTQEQTFDPASEQADGFDGVTVYGVTSSIDANITAGNIKDGVTILGVTGNYQGGPTDGGAVATGKGYTKTDPGMGTEFPALDITFSTLPTGFDTANHTYHMYVAAPYFAEGEDPENQSLMYPLIDGNDRYISTQYNYDSTTQTYTIDYYDLDFTHYGPSIATIVYIFEDDLLHLKWIVPCTFIDQTVQP